VDPDNYGLIEMTLSFGVIFAFGIWQLVSVKRKLRESAPAQTSDTMREPKA
jgi:hypothetical protein